MKTRVTIGLLALFLALSFSPSFAQAPMRVTIIIVNQTDHPIKYFITGSLTKKGEVEAQRESDIQTVVPVSAGEVSEYQYGVHLAYAYDRGAGIDLRAQLGMKPDGPYVVEADGEVLSVDVPWWDVVEDYKTEFGYGLAFYITVTQKN